MVRISGGISYNEFAGSSFNDVFAFFLNGTNVAVLSDRVTPVSINNVNNGWGANPPKNSHYYRDNSAGTSGGNPATAPFRTQMDGLTTVLRVTAAVIPGKINHIKLAIADVADYSFDSVVMIRAGSFQTGGKVV